MLNYEEFEVALIKELEKRYPDTRIIRKPQYKINGIKRGIMLVGVGDIQPIIYPEDLYDGYRKSKDMELIVENIDLTIKHEKITGFKNIVKDWNQAKEHIYPYIVHKEKNQLCMDCCEYVYKEVLDFMYGTYIELIDVEDGGVACVNVTKELLAVWKVSEDIVFEMAEKNAKYYVKPMRQLINELVRDVFSETDTPESESMFVVTNATRNRGAAGMFDLDLLRNTAEKLQSDFFILPSSIHEVILVLENMAPSKKQMQEMVVEVNQSHVEKDEYLSDNIYYFSRERQNVSIVELD